MSISTSRWWSHVGSSFQSSAFRSSLYASLFVSVRKQNSSFCSLHMEEWHYQLGKSLQIQWWWLMLLEDFTTYHSLLPSVIILSISTTFSFIKERWFFRYWAPCHQKHCHSIKPRQFVAVFIWHQSVLQSENKASAKFF